MWLQISEMIPVFYISQVGCDRSSALIQICAERGFQVFVSDALMVPLHSASFDACISIAVIHHFSTQVMHMSLDPFETILENKCICIFSVPQISVLSSNKYANVELKSN